MFGQKEITIIKALVEEEIASANKFGSNTEDDVLKQYISTLSGIEGHLHNMSSFCSADIETGHIASF